MAARKTWLIDALGSALSNPDPVALKRQLAVYVPVDVQQILARLGIRDEHVFPTPVVLEALPSLVGYYRLLTGVGQKAFYRSHTGMSEFRTMENNNTLTEQARQRLDEFCLAMAEVLAELVRGIAATLSPRDLNELRLLTFGSNFYGSANTALGAAAVNGVMDAIAAVLAPEVVDESSTALSVATAHGRSFSIVRGNDPDVRVEETTGGGAAKVLAIEVKGGVDAANVYNRGGEAEKSHKAAKSLGYPECWTVIRKTGIDETKLRSGATSTDAWFDTGHVLAQQGPDWESFRRELRRVVGLPV